MTLRDAEQARRHAERWCAYHFGDLTAEEELAYEDELLDDADACAELYRELNLDACLEALAPPREKASEPVEPVSRRWPRLALAVGFAISVGALGWMAGRGGPPSLPKKEQVCRPLEPAGGVPGPIVRFVWTRQEGAARYRVVVEDVRSGAMLHQATVSDTLYFLPAAVSDALVPGGRWRWHVEPVGRHGEDLGASGTARFRRER